MSLPTNLRAVGLTLVSVTVIACSESRVGGVQPANLLMVPSLAQLVDENGDLPAPPVEPAEYPQLGYDGARRFTEAYVHTFASTSVSMWAKAAGAAIDFRTLRLCFGPAFAKSAYELQSPSVSAGVRNAVGGRFISQYCDASGSSRVLVSIAASATMLKIVRGGRLEFPLEGSENAFMAHGIPPQFGGRVAIPTMRDAIALAVQRTGRRVAEPPELVMSPLPGGPLFARWLVKLEEPELLQASQSAESSAIGSVFVGNAVGVFTGTEVLVANDSGNLPILEDRLPVRSSIGGVGSVIPLRLRPSSARQVRVLRSNGRLE